jgi:hypothetical protein
MLKHTCYDCHSNQTRWPCYSHVAPFSWEIVHHVDLGRRENEFLGVGKYYPVARNRKFQAASITRRGHAALVVPTDASWCPLKRQRSRATGSMDRYRTGRPRNRNIGQTDDRKR